jgi:hypothetical protein
MTPKLSQVKRQPVALPSCDEQLRIPVVGAPKPIMVGLPIFIDVGPEETAHLSTSSALFFRRTVPEDIKDANVLLSHA